MFMGQAKQLKKGKITMQKGLSSGNNTQMNLLKINLNSDNSNNIGGNSCLSSESLRKSFGPSPSSSIVKHK